MILLWCNLLVIFKLRVPRAWAATARGPQTQDQSHLRVLGRAKFSTLRRLEDSVDVRLETIAEHWIAPRANNGTGKLRLTRGPFPLTFYHHWWNR